MALTKVKAGNILLTTPGASSNDVTPATTQYVTTALANLADSAPSTLNTLNELAAALGDDANFSTTVTNSIAAKLPLAGGTLTGGVQAPGLYVGSTNTSFDFYNNGTSYLNGAVTVDDNLTVNGILAISTASTADTVTLTRGTTSHNNMLKFKTGSSDKWIVGQRNDSTDHFRFYSYGTSSDVLSIQTDGKVGIGRTDPTQLLEVHKAAGGDQTVAKFSAHNYEDTGKTFIEIGTEYGDGSSRIGSFNDTGNTSVLVFDTHSASSGQFIERMRIQSNGGISLTGNHQFNFRATGLSNSGLGNVMVFDTVASGNAAGCYSTSSGMYQAAIDGWYMVSVGIRYNTITGSGYARPQLRFLADNSSTWLYPHNGFWIDPIIGADFGTGSYMNCTYSVPMYLANGDNIQLIEQGASVTITHNHDESHFGVIFMG